MKIWLLLVSYVIQSHGHNFCRLYTMNGPNLEQAVTSVQRVGSFGTQASMKQDHRRLRISLSLS